MLGRWVGGSKHPYLIKKMAPNTELTFLRFDLGMCSLTFGVNKNSSPQISYLCLRSSGLIFFSIMIFLENIVSLILSVSSFKQTSFKYGD